MRSQKLKVLLTRGWGLGGGQVWAHEFANHLVQLGHDVRVVFLHAWWPGMRKTKHEVMGPTEEASYRRIELKVPLFAEPCWLTSFLRGHLKNEPVDVIVSTGGEAALVHLVRRVCMPRHVASFHSTYPDWIGLRQLITRSVNLTRRGIAQTYSHLTQHLDRFSMTRADQVVCSSRNQVDRVVDGLRVPSPRVKMIYYGIDTDRFSPPRVRCERRGREILYAGGPWPSKGVEVLLTAFAAIRSKFPDVGIASVGAGDWLPYREKIKALGLSDCIRNYGHVSHEEMLKLYRSACVLAAPTRHESFGLVLGEAMACGLPVVATRVTSIPEVVTDGVTGLLVPVDDPSALADALETLLSDARRAAAMGDAGRTRVEQRFSWTKIIRQWEQLLLQVADGISC